MKCCIDNLIPQGITSLSTPPNVTMFVSLTGKYLFQFSQFNFFSQNMRLKNRPSWDHIPFNSFPEDPFFEHRKLKGKHHKSHPFWWCFRKSVHIIELLTITIPATLHDGIKGMRTAWSTIREVNKSAENEQ